MRLKRHPAKLVFVASIAPLILIAIRIANAAQAPPASPAATPAPQPTVSSQNTTPLSFDAASIKERDDSVPLSIVGLQFFPGRLVAHCVTLRSFMFYAYNLTLSSPVEGLPDWAAAPCSDFSTKDTYDFQATMPPETAPQQARQMMQSLLAERFKLAIHWEKRNMPVYELVVAPGGFKLKQSDPKDDPPIAPHSIGCPQEDRGCHNIVTGSTPIPAFVGILGSVVGRPVIDKTGLTGAYYLNLKWAGDTAADSPLPSLPAALREQFGLELKSETGPVDVLVIDHVEKPTPN